MRKEGLASLFFPFPVVCHHPVRSTCLCHYCAAAGARKPLPSRGTVRAAELDHFLCPQALQDEAESREGSWEKLQEVIGRLEDSCPSIAGRMREKCQDAHSRYAQKDQPALLTLRPSKGFSFLQDGWCHLWLCFRGCSSSCKVQCQESCSVPYTALG